MNKIYLYDFKYNTPVFGLGYFPSSLKLDNEDADELLEMQKQNPEYIFNLLTNVRGRHPTLYYHNIVENMDSSEIVEYKKLAIKVSNLYANTIKYLNDNKKPEKLFNATKCKTMLEFETEQYNAKILYKKYKKDIETSASSSLFSLLMFNLDLISVKKETFNLNESYKIITKALNFNNDQITELLDKHEKAIEYFLNLQCDEPNSKGQNVNFRPYMQQLKNNLLQSEEKLEK